MAAFAAYSAAHAEPRPRIAIIIDDIGYRAALDARALELPQPVAIAVLPGSPHARRMAATAAAQSRDVLVHLPMQPLERPDALDGYAPVALRLSTTADELHAIVAGALAAVPEARGINNHMGSLLTQQPAHMRWLMQTLACRRNMFFIDSYTTPDSVAMAEARRQFVPTARRDVFLDDAPDAASVRAQFHRLVAMAHRRGQALAIGHPQPETLAVLEQELAALDAHGVTLVPATALLDAPAPDLDVATTAAGDR